MSLSCEHPGMGHLPPPFQCHLLPSTPNGVLPTRSLGMQENPDFNLLLSSPCHLFSSVVFIFPEWAQDSQSLDHTKGQGSLSSSGWVLFRSRCVPIIKHLPCFSKIYSETVFQTPVYSSRRTVVCFCSDGNQTQNIVETRPIELIQWVTPSPTLPGS